MFVSASWDNTLRIWPIDDNSLSGQEGHLEGDGFGEEGKSHGSHGGGKRGGDPSDPFYAKGMKLRGHEFGMNNIGGVLCVCAVPSLPPSDGNGNSSSSNSSPHDETTSTISAGQFCSGGSDGRIRVWDVRSAFHLKKVPKSGMYGTVQLQCIDPPPNMMTNNKQRNNDNKKHPSPSAAAPGSPTSSQPGVAAAITSLVCTHDRGRGEGNVALFAGDASGAIRRYSRKK